MDRLNQRIEESIRAADYRKAKQTPKEEPRADPEDDAIWQKLQAMHMEPVQPISSHQEAYFPSMDIYDLHEFSETIRHSTKYKSPGIWADSSDVLNSTSGSQGSG